MKGLGTCAGCLERIRMSIRRGRCDAGVPRSAGEPGDHGSESEPAIRRVGYVLIGMMTKRGR